MWRVLADAEQFKPNEKNRTIAPQNVGAAISRPPKIIVWPDFSGVLRAFPCGRLIAAPTADGGILLSGIYASIGASIVSTLIVPPFGGEC